MWLPCAFALPVAVSILSYLVLEYTNTGRLINFQLQEYWHALWLPNTRYDFSEAFVEDGEGAAPAPYTSSYFEDWQSPTRETGTIDRLEYPPKDLNFFLDYVTQSRPVIFTRAMEDWPALKKWTNEYLLQTMGDSPVEVDLSPNQLYHQPTEGYIVRSTKELWPFSRYLKHLENRTMSKQKYYATIQQQEMHTTFKNLEPDVRIPEFPVPLQVSNVNIWISAQGKKSLLHFDVYENLLCQVAGEKTLVLYDPMQLPLLYPMDMKERDFVFKGDDFKSCGAGICTRDLNNEVDNFSPVNVAKPDLKRYPLFAKAKPINITLKAGEMLYLPSFWWHSVTSTADSQNRNIAVNIWYHPHSRIFAHTFLAMRDAIMPYDQDDVPEHMMPKEKGTPKEGAVAEDGE